MTKTKSTKRALLSSVLALVLCVSMLVGTTFAWFTDSVTSGRNKIVAGNLDLEIEYSLDGENWAPVNETVNVFGTTDLWEPGHREVALLRVHNAGSLALKYEVSTVVYNETPSVNVYDKEFKLSDYLILESFCYGEDSLGVDYMIDNFFSSRDIWFITEEHQFGENLGNAMSTQTLDAGSADHYYFISITMPETVGNEANYKNGATAPSIEFGINVLATQATVEFDSFDNQYDANAWMEVAETPAIDAEGAVNVWTAEQLAGVMSNVDGIKTINIMENIDLSGRTWTPANFWDPENTALLTINGNGHTISNMVAASGKNVGFIGSNSRNITINDLTFENAIVTTPGSFAGTVIGYAYGNITLNNVDVVDSVVTGSSVSGSSVSIRIGGLIGFIPSDAGTLTLTDCDVNGSEIAGYHNVGAMVGTTMTNKTVTIESCSATNNTLQYASSKVGAFAFGASTSGYTEYVPTSGFTAEINELVAVVKSTDALNNAIANGVTNLKLTAGTYQMPAVAKGKTLTITGNDKANTIIEVVPAGQGEANGQLDYNLDGSNVTFNNVTIKTNSQLYAGYARLSATYNNCVIQNTYNLGVGNSAFYDCTFNITNEYLRVGGASSAVFERCTFNTDGRAILVFQDGTSVAQTVTVKDCAFNATASAYTWNGIHVAAVSYDGSRGGSYTVNFEGDNVVDSDFNGLWQIKAGENNVTVNGLN